MTDDTVLAERRGRVLEITLNRPPANAINTALSRAIYARLRELQDSPDLSVAILRGAGERIFSAGWDLKEVAAEGFDSERDNDPTTRNAVSGRAASPASPSSGASPSRSSPR
jgi:crotonobetainyl-CoA hydratase